MNSVCRAEIKRAISGRYFVGSSAAMLAVLLAIAARGALQAAFRNKTFGICLKEPALMPNLTVWENVALPLIRGMDALKRERAEKAQLKQLGMRQVAYAYPSQLKSMEAQISSLSRAMITQPPVLYWRT